MSDNLIIFNKEYFNAEGIITTNTNDVDLLYVAPQGTKTISENGDNIDVYSYDKVNVNISNPTVWQDSSDKIHLPVSRTESTTSTIAVTPLKASSNGTYYPLSNQAFNAVIVNMTGYYSVDDVATKNIPNYINCDVSYIGNYAFYYCSSLITASFSNCTNISSTAFAYCSALTSISFPVCTSISTYAFECCSKLTTASFPECTSIGDYAFYQCSSLSTASFPVCASIGFYAFAYCPLLTTISFPSCTYISGSAFYYCSSLTTASFPSCTYIGNYAFYACYNLLSLYLLGSSICSLASIDAFYSTPISNYTTSTGGIQGSIFVPSSLYATYIASTNWVTYSNRFVSV